jgi:NADP-dependent 3-hydroxy acid dehydrogenase YdfG
MPHSTFDKLHLEEWERMVDVNIKGILYVIAVCLPVMCNKKRKKDDLYEH